MLRLKWLTRLADGADGLVEFDGGYVAVAGGSAKHNWWGYWHGTYLQPCKQDYASAYLAKRDCERWLIVTGIMDKIQEGTDGK
jgi:hypothetical protein